MNPAIQYLTGGQRAGTESLVQGFHRTWVYDPGNGNAVTVTETAFETIAHLGHESKRGLIPNEGARQQREVKLQQDVEETLLAVHREADADQAGTMGDVIIWQGRRYIVMGIEDLSNHPVPMLRQRTYSLQLEVPA